MNIEKQSLLLTQIDNELSSLNVQITDLKLKKRKIEHAIAHYLCPFRVGDRVIDEQGYEVEIAEIHYSSWPKHTYTLTIFKLKKNKSLYLIATTALGDLSKYKLITQEDNP